MADILCLNLKLEKIERKCDNERVEWICKLLQASSQFERFNSKIFYKALYVRSQAQWVLLYALRADIIRVPTRFFKWESGRDWGELYFKHFQETLGLGFENDAVPAVNSYEWEWKYQANPLGKVKLFMRSGDSVLKPYSFLETHLPMAGRIISSRANAVLAGIAHKSNELLEQLFSMYDECEPEDNIPQETVQNPTLQDNLESIVGKKHPCASEEGNLEKKGRGSKQQYFCPKVLVGEELERAMATFQAVAPPTAVCGSAQCWQCEGCTGMNPPSAQRCLVEGCAMERAQPCAEESVVDRPSTPVPITIAEKEKCKNKKTSKGNQSGNVKGNSRKGGRRSGATNILVPVNKMKKLPDVQKFRNFWSTHKMVPQDRSVDANGKKYGKAEQKCFFFTQSGSGMCPQLLALNKVYGSNDKARNNDGRCSKYCNACKKPFHEICTWEYHRAIIKGFDADEWVREVWIRENCGEGSGASDLEADMSGEESS